jgi:hypothetical protein
VSIRLPFDLSALTLEQVEAWAQAGGFPPEELRFYLWRTVAEHDFLGPNPTCRPDVDRCALT